MGTSEEQTRVGLLGAGFIGRVHAKDLAAHIGIDLLSVCDANSDVGQSVATEFGTSFEAHEGAVINDDQVDAVWIDTSANTNSDLIRRSLSAGKAVFCEKPIAIDVGEARSLRDDCAQAESPVFVGFNRRFDLSLLRLKQHLLNGSVGEPEVVTITSRDPKPPPRDYMAISPGGVFYDTMIHDLDMAVWLLDEPPVEI